MADEKAVLLESLCSQTEKLEECRGQVAQLKQLLFTQEPPLEPSDREAHLLDLLKVGFVALEVHVVCVNLRLVIEIDS